MWLAVILYTGYAIAQDTSPMGPTQPDIAKNCNAWHTVEMGDSCYSIETKYKISHKNFIEWNPSVSDDCLTNFWASYAYCVGVGPKQGDSSTMMSTTSQSSTSGGGTTSPMTSTINATYSTRVPKTTWNITTPTIETVFPPKRTQPGQPPYCRDWHYVSAGDTCETVVASSSWVTMEEFLEWNPTVKSDCSGLFVGWWVCIGIQPQTVTDTLEYTTTPPPISVPPPTKYTPTTYPPINSTFTASPTLPDTAQKCQSFHQAETGETCRSVLARFNYMSEKQFFEWNPALKGNCDGLWEGYWYCVAVEGFTPILPRVTAKPSPVPIGQPNTCNSWFLRADDETCDDIALIFGAFSKADFIKWNPSVGPDCAGIIQDTYYCVGVEGTPTTRTAPLPTYTAPTETPVQSGIASNCNDFWFVSLSDTCESIAKHNDITEKQFFAWNPAVGESSCDNLIPDFYVCVGVETSSTTNSPPITSDSMTMTDEPSSTEPQPPSTTSDGGSVSTPTPVQPGMIAGCKKFHEVQAGDGCWNIANAAGIDL
ncbi:hypothetical protein FQN49_006172, partial [Arthroderma sp. PD_2]